MQTKQMVSAAALILALAAPCLAAPANTSADDTGAVQQAVTQFYAALNTLFTGDSAPMQQIWSHAADVTYMGPAGGFQVGWEQVRPVWESQSALKLGGKVEPSEIHVTVGGDLAAVQCYELGDNLDAQGRPEHVSIRATSLFRRENGEWKMVGHHTDPLSFLETQPGTTPAQ